MKTRVTITLDSDLYYDIKEQAQRENRSVSNMIEQILKEGTENGKRETDKEIR